MVHILLLENRLAHLDFLLKKAQKQNIGKSNKKYFIPYNMRKGILL